MSASDQVLRGLMIGIAREIARQSGEPVKQPLCQQGAWMIMTGGFGLSCEQVGRAAGLTKQAISYGNQRIIDRCDDRAIEKTLMDVADIFGVSL